MSRLIPKSYATMEPMHVDVAGLTYGRVVVTVLTRSMPTIDGAPAAICASSAESTSVPIATAIAPLSRIRRVSLRVSISSIETMFRRLRYRSNGSSDRQDDESLLIDRVINPLECTLSAWSSAAEDP